MKPEILASLIGTFVTAIATIIVAWIQAQSKKSEQSSTILVPDGYKVHRPKSSRNWFFVLPIALFGGILSYFSFSWFYSTPPPQASATASESPTIVPSATSTQNAQASLLSKDCINASLWTSLDSQSMEQHGDCLSLDKWGIFAIDDGLSISSTNNSSESIRQGIFIPIGTGTQISIELTISELYTPTDNSLANLSLGVVSRNSLNLEKDTLLIYQRESPTEGYPILVKKEERGDGSSYLLQEGGYRRYGKNTLQEILLVISDSHQLTIYIDGSPVLEVYIPFQDKTFWIGYRLAANALINAEISELQIQTK
jgi:hypothetical protein